MCIHIYICAYVHTYMHTYMHLGSWIFCVGSYLYSYAVVIDVVNIGSFLHHVGSYQSHCIGIGSLIVAAIGLNNSFFKWMHLVSFVAVGIFSKMLHVADERKLWYLESKKSQFN